MAQFFAAGVDAGWRRWLLRLFPLLAFFGGFLWDALTLGRRVRVDDFYMLGAYLLAAAVLIQWLARRYHRGLVAPAPGTEWRQRLAQLRWHAPYLLVQFCFGGIFSALFILYFKSSGYLGSWLTAAVLGGLLVANEFLGERYGRKFTLTWALFALNACLLANFIIPHLLGSIDPLWFYVSSAASLLLTWALWRLAPRGCGRLGPAVGVVGTLLAAWFLGTIAPVPLVAKGVAVGHQFVQQAGSFVLQVEPPPFWAIWREQSGVVHMPAGGRLYAVSAVHAPLGVSASLRHRWERHGAAGWEPMYQRDFESTGGREHGFRAYSWVLDPLPGDWRFSVLTQDGRTIATQSIEVRRSELLPDDLQRREF